MKNPFRIVVADQDPEVYAELHQYNGQVLQFIRYCSTPEETVAACRELEPDLLLLDLLPDLGGDMVIQTLIAQKERPRILVYTSGEYEKILKGVGLDYYILKPFNTDILLKRIIQTIDYSLAKKMMIPHEHIKEMVRSFLSSLGMSENHTGYTYLVEAILIAFENPGVLNNIHQQIYPQIAERYQKTVKQVERVIRYAIESTWLKGNLQTIESLFYHMKFEKGKPTNNQFIATVSDRIRLSVEIGPFKHS
jgi:two-component system response regulator (stage 0 sporulation protein A)